MKSILTAFFLVFGAARAADHEFVIYVEEKNGIIVVSCDKSTYLLKVDESNDQFLMDKVVIQGRPITRPDYKIIMDSNVRFTSYFHLLDHLNRLGYENLNTYLLSRDRKSMLPLNIKITGISVPSK